MNASIPVFVRARFPIFIPINWEMVAFKVPARYLRRDEDTEILITITAQLFAAGEKKKAAEKMAELSRPDLIDLVERLRGSVNVTTVATGSKPEFWCDEVFSQARPFANGCRAANLDRHLPTMHFQYDGSYRE